MKLLKKFRELDVLRQVWLCLLVLIIAVFLVLYIKASGTRFIEYCDEDLQLIEAGEDHAVYEGNFSGRPVRFTAYTDLRKVVIEADGEKVGGYILRLAPADFDREKEGKYNFELWNDEQEMLYAGRLTYTPGGEQVLIRDDKRMFLTDKIRMEIDNRGILTIYDGTQTLYSGPEVGEILSMLLYPKLKSPVLWGFYAFGVGICLVSAATVLVRTIWYNYRHPTPFTYHDEWYNKTDPVQNVKYDTEFHERDYDEYEPSVMFKIMNMLLAIIFAFAAVMVFIIGMV